MTMARCLPRVRMCHQLSTTCGNATEASLGELPVAVDLSHLWPIASETVNPIDWPLPPPYTG